MSRVLKHLYTEVLKVGPGEVTSVEGEDWDGGDLFEIPTMTSLS